MFYIIESIIDFFGGIAKFIVMTISALFVSIVITVGILIGLGGLLGIVLPDVVSEEVFTDTVIVESVNFRPSTTSTSFIMSGKIMVPVTNTIQAKYNTIFKYGDTTIKRDNKRIYEQCKDNINKEVNCELKLTTYDNGKSTLSVENIINFK